MRKIVLNCVVVRMNNSIFEIVLKELQFTLVILLSRSAFNQLILYLLMQFNSPELYKVVLNSSTVKNNLQEDNELRKEF